MPAGALHLGINQPGRRAGLSQKGYTLPSLLQSFKAPGVAPPTNMPSRPAAKWSAEVANSAVEEDTEDISRLPDSSSDEADNSADIPRSTFAPRSLKSENASESRNNAPLLKKGKSNEAADEVIGISTVRGQSIINPTPDSSNSSQISTSSAKRKSEEMAPKFGAKMTDELGFLKRPGTKKAKQQTYGKTRILVTKKKKPAIKTFAIDDSPRKSGVAEKKTVQKYDIQSSPASTQSPVKLPAINKYDIGELSDSDEDVTNQPVTSATLVSGMSKQLPLDVSQGTERKRFRYDVGLDTDFVSTAQDLVDEDKDRLAEVYSKKFKDDEFLSMTQQSCCPMCGAAVSPDAIRSYSLSGHMNIRTQEKFCRSHRMKTAEDDWDLNNYPKIDWDELDSRISKHHSFIKKLINGRDSHYRQLLSEKVDAGKDRNLMKMTTNLTPGYYGARGLRTISENIFHKFTPLLKKRIVEDSLMSARGYTAFVQTVLVPEVTVLLIMEDMSVKVDEARQILSDSVDIGELLNEEIEDVVRKKIVDSEGEDESD